MVYYSRTIRMPFSKVLNALSRALEEQEFEIVSTVDMRARFKAKFNTEFHNYTLLGVCNPALDFDAICLESHVGLNLPCRILVQQHENGDIELSTSDPFECSGAAYDNTVLKTIAQQALNGIRMAIDSIESAVGSGIDDYPTDFRQN